MPFTVATFFHRINLPENVLRKHRFRAGKSIKNSWWNRFHTNVPRVYEPQTGVKVCSYPDDFFPIAKKIAQNYIDKNRLPVRQRRRKAA